MFRTITARFPGICRRCDGPIAIGQQIRYDGPRRTYHLAADCRAVPPQPEPSPARTMPSDNDLMNATIAASLQQTFLGLMQQPARMTDPLADIAQPEPVQPEPEPIAPIVPPLTFSTIAGATVRTVPPTVARISYNARTNTRRLISPTDAVARLAPSDLM